MQFNNSANKRFNFLIVKIFLVIAILSSCERDDICIDPVTPNLVLRFYDTDDRETKKSAAGVVVKIEGTINPDTTFTVTKDSITLPIRVTEDFTKYSLTKTISETPLETETSTFTINYSRENIFVGRSCGYKTIFKEVTLSGIENKWTSSIEITNPLNIENETEAHIRIYH